MSLPATSPKQRRRLLRTMSRWLVLAAGLAVGVAVGWTAALATGNVVTDSVPVPSRESAATDTPAQSALSEIQSPASDPDAPLARSSAPPEVAAATNVAALTDVAASTDVAALERLLDESADLPAKERQRIQFAAYWRYAALDPQAAVDRLLGAGDANDVLLSMAFAAWAMQDADAALRRVETLNVVQREWASAAVWSVSGAHDDPQRAWQDALAGKSGQARSEALQSIAHIWAGAAPGEALAAIDELPESQDKDTLRMTVLFTWVEEDQDAALQWAQQHTDRNDYLVPTLLRSMAEDSPLRAMELAVATDAKERQLAVMLAMDVWVKNDPHAAFEWVLSNQASLDDVSLAAKPLRGIAETAPRQALALAARLDATRRRLAISAILGQWAANDAPAAAAWLDSSSGELESARVATIARAYARQHGEEAFDWVLAQAPEHQGDALNTVTRELAKRSPQRTLDLARRIGEPQLYAAAVRSIVSAWAGEDPQAARRWIAANAEDSQRASLFSALYMAWAYIDQAEAAANALRHDNRSERDAALAAMTTSVARQNPDLAERLYDEIQQDEQRRSIARYLSAVWRRTDPERAKRYRDQR